MVPFFCVFVGAYASDMPVSSSTTRYYGVLVRQYFVVHEGQKIGSLSSIKLPMINWYVLYDFFVVPEYRSKGYGRLLLSTALADAKKGRASKIFVQPGPFERHNGIYVPIGGNEQVTKLKLLLKFYQSFGFEQIKNGWRFLIIPFLYCAYKLIGIGENPAFLMVR